MKQCMSNAIDWTATGSMLQGIGTNVGSLAVLAAALIGANTFKGWRKQQFAARRAQEAEEILRATYKARDALAQIRSPLISGYELDRAEETLGKNERWEGELKAKQARMRTTQAYYNRLSHHESEMEALDAVLPMARALFGEELESAVRKLRHQFWIVQIDAESYIDDNGSDQDFTKKIRKGMYRIFDDENEVTIAINGSVQIIESTCLPVLRLEAR